MLQLVPIEIESTYRYTVNGIVSKLIGIIMLIISTE